MGARDGREVDIAMCPCNGRRNFKGGIMGEEKVALAVVWRVRKLGFYGKNVHFLKTVNTLAPQTKWWYYILII